MAGLALTLGSVACLGFFGEEISWGQHWFGFESPEFFRTHNIQQETNLHNFSKGIERGLKTVVALTLVGSVYIGARRRRRSTSTDDDMLGWLLPGRACVPSALLAAVVYFTERYRTWFDPDWGPLLEVTLKETFEMYLAFVLAVYLFSAYHRRADAPHQSRAAR